MRPVLVSERETEHLLRVVGFRFVSRPSMWAWLNRVSATSLDKGCDHPIYIVVGQSIMKRQAEDLGTDPIGRRAMGRTVRDGPSGGASMKWLIVECGRDANRIELVQYVVAAILSADQHIKSVPG